MFPLVLGTAIGQDCWKMSASIWFEGQGRKGMRLKQKQNSGNFIGGRSRRDLQISPFAPLPRVSSQHLGLGLAHTQEGSPAEGPYACGLVHCCSSVLPLTA